MEELTLTDRGTHFNFYVCVCVSMQEEEGGEQRVRERETVSVKESERAVNTAARRGRTSVKEINL